MRHGDGQDLVRPAGVVVALLAIDDVVQAPRRRVPEPRVERAAAACRFRPQIVALGGEPGPIEPAGEQHQRVVPERVDLDGLAAPRRHHPAVDEGVHPGELDAGRALREQPVVVDVDVERGALAMAAHDVLQDRQQLLDERVVAGDGVVAVQRVEEPERRVGGVVQPFALAFREHVRDQAVPHVQRERPQDVVRLGVAAGDEGQALEADHRVAAPVGEPRVAGDHRARLGADGVGLRVVDGARRRPHDELIRGQRQQERVRLPAGSRRSRPAAAGAGSARAPTPGPAARRRGAPRARSSRSGHASSPGASISVNAPGPCAEVMWS